MKVPFTTAPGLDQLNGICHGFFGRNGGVSQALFESLNCSPFSGDDVDCIQENRDRIRSSLRATRLITNKQVHGSNVRLVDRTTDPSTVCEADGLVTSQPGIALGALGADCAPVLFADSIAGVIGAAHAGWQGALAGITDAVIKEMCASGASEKSIVVAVGPAIQSQSYEVGDRFRENLLKQSPVDAADCFFRHESTAQVHFDLPAYIALRLKAAGLENITVLSVDTYTNPSRYFSYRRACHNNEDNYGRQIGAICLTQSD